MATGKVEWLRKIEADGTHFDVGKTLGRQFGNQIAGLFDNYAFYQEVLDPFREKNPALFNHMVESQKTLYPRSWRMLEGIADGAGNHLSDLALYNMRGEVRALTTRVDGANNPVLEKGTPVFDVGRAGNLGRGCCDLVCGYLLGHNEDGDPAELQSSAYANLIVDGRKVNAVVYVGALVGNAATFLYRDNEVIAVTVDDLWGVGAGPLKKGVKYGGRQFAASEIIWADDLRKVIKTLIPDNRLAGFYYTASEFSKYTESTSLGTATGVEVGPFTHEVFNISITGKPYVHTNRHKHIKDPEYAHPSSEPRERRFAQLLAGGVPDYEYELVKMMFDKGNKEYEGRFQIFRTNPEAEGKLGLHHLWTMVTDIPGRCTNIYRFDEDKQMPVIVDTIKHDQYGN
jgi:hypothetical protein